MPALTRAEAETRARLIQVHHYAIDLDLTRGDETFGSTVVIRFTALEDGVGTFAELKPSTVHRVVLDGRELDPAALDDNRLPLPDLAAGAHELRVEADMPYSRTGEGMHRFTDPADGETYLYTQLFLDDFQRVAAVFDQPDLKAVFDVTVTAPPAWTVLGNGIAERVAGQGRWKIARTPPISTYLLAVAAGPWHSLRTEHAGLPFGLHCRRSLARHLDHDARELLDITRRCFDRFHELFEEPYPFDSYDQAFVPEFNAGAMENPGLVTFSEEFVHRSAVTHTERQYRAVVIAHEMAHMWFGNLVTLRWWDDIWLNESFAEYLGYQVLSEATGFTTTWTDFAIARKVFGYDADQRPSTHPVAPEAVPDTASALLNFDGISYAKGASALRQLVAWLGTKNFLAGVNDHIARHCYGNATLDDFIASLARATDRDVHAWAAQWLRTTGVDTLQPHFENPAAPVIVRTGSRPHHIAVGLYDRAVTDPGRLVLRERLEADLAAAPVPLLPEGRTVRPDLVLLNDGDLSYTKIRFDDQSWTTITESLSGLPDPLSRAVVWNAARDLVRDGELPPADYLALVQRHLPAETDPAIAQGVLTFTREQLIDRYRDPARRTADLTLLAGVCRALLSGTDTGPHLSAARTLIDSAVTEHDTRTLRGWLTDGRIAEGPALDPELRWRLLLRLTVLGAATPGDIADELLLDPSANGQEGAARCRAALPDPEAKKAAWTRMFEDDTLSAYLFTAIAQGFWQPEQHDLLDPYVPRYFPAATALAARRGPALAVAAGRYAFPTTATDTATLRLGGECLRNADPAPALRRRLADQLHDLQRALKIQATFPTPAAANTRPAEGAGTA
ncbi:aminopeptidase N [Streptomyces sp. H10-C2]|uniref:aminopeptidase N n=1 Tax=unclassified Streptomyces TaxID=2593676 RepID=UPI0024BBB58E|nr:MULTISPECIES: aminopeptidase N [unclassified Streptomyces]MDJ0344494.1 aminopeptidase N [Streptomyces sp. PH10-H1]MDJ0369632.1 aminopeptidase N [Streptomyces sp. H10-C2]